MQNQLQACKMMIVGVQVRRSMLDVDADATAMMMRLMCYNESIVCLGYIFIASIITRLCPAK